MKTFKGDNYEFNLKDAGALEEMRGMDRSTMIYNIKSYDGAKNLSEWPEH